MEIMFNCSTEGLDDETLEKIKSYDTKGFLLFQLADNNEFIMTAHGVTTKDIAGMLYLVMKDIPEISRLLDVLKVLGERLEASGST